MTFTQILQAEENNWNVIYLYKEGIFLKAYQHSACLIHMYIHEFKVSKRYIKSVNEYVYSLGFPMDSSRKWLNNCKVERISETIFRCEIDKSVSETEYEHWKECVTVNAGDAYTPHTHIIEKAPVYKNAYDLLLQVYAFSVNVSRNVQAPLCEHLKMLSYRLCYIIRNLYDASDRDEMIQKGLDLCSEIEYVLQVLKDLREISINTFALSSERVVSVSKQLTALRRTVTA